MLARMTMWSKVFSLREGYAMADPSFRAKVELAVKAATCASFAIFFLGTTPLLVRVVKTEREVAKFEEAFFSGEWKETEEKQRP
ncbi:hypothetical protein RchiOBHm_Chr5g0006911 [Rosa chinensis]|uniref:Uncharacterized protein n=1 Tax=Rosa chinensis TaxID=74649 RepID=A0A2P6Q3N2_ROSCH|nr:hypothetical protein RchiOBHm_Chr5g0006911 [Rosa chinensis]